MDFQSKEKKSLIIHVLSVVLPLAALAFVVEKIWSVRLQIFSELDVKQAILIILGGSILYALDNLLLVLAWRQLVDWFGETKTNFVVSMKIYGRTQIAKYIPGNIFHLPSRHILGRQLGLDHVPLLGAAIFEIVGLLIVSGIISSLGVVIRKGQIILPIGTFAFFFLSAFSPLVLGIIFHRIPVLRKLGLPQKSIAETYKVLLPNWFIYLFFLLVAGMILWIIIYGVKGSWSIVPPGIVLSAYAASWLAGTFTPGSPAGAGVREAVLILMLSGFLGESTSVLIALVSRMVTIFGDVCFYLIVQIIR
jgi:glycosyltransferase 2 family protein